MIMLSLSIPFSLPPHTFSHSPTLFHSPTTPPPPSGEQRDEAELQSRIKVLESDKRDEVCRLSAELENAQLLASHLQEQSATSQDRAGSLKEELERCRRDVALLKEESKEQEETFQQKVRLLEGEVASLRAADKQREMEAAKRERERDLERAEAGHAGDIKVRALEAKCEALESSLALVKKEKEQGRDRQKEGEKAKAVLEEECERLRESVRVVERERERERESAALELQQERARAAKDLERERVQWNEQRQTLQAEAALAKQVVVDEVGQAQEREGREREEERRRELEVWQQRLGQVELVQQRDREQLETCRQERDAALRALEERISECAEIRQRLSVLEVQLGAAGVRQERTENMAQDLADAARLPRHESCPVSS